MVVFRAGEFLRILTAWMWAQNSFPITMPNDLIHCCPGALTEVYAAWRPVPRQIPAWCVAHQRSIKYLNIKTYGHHFGIATGETSGSQPSWYRVDEKMRFAILQRDGFACVWCAEPIRRGEVDVVESSEILVGNAFIAVEETSARTFFGHDADHLFALAEHDLLEKHVQVALLQKIRREWIVTSCGRCNRGHCEQEIDISAMLSVYARHLLQRGGKPDFSDAEDFVAALKMLAFLRARSRATGTGG